MFFSNLSSLLNISNIEKIEKENSKMLRAVKYKDQTETDGEGKKLIAACIVEECIQPAARRLL